MMISKIEMQKLRIMTVNCNTRMSLRLIIKLPLFLLHRGARTRRYWSGGTGRGNSTSFCHVSVTPWDWETCGGSLTSVTGTVEVSVRGGSRGGCQGWIWGGVSSCHVSVKPWDWRTCGGSLTSVTGTAGISVSGGSRGGVSSCHVSVTPWDWRTCGGSLTSVTGTAGVSVRGGSRRGRGVSGGTRGGVSGADLGMSVLDLGTGYHPVMYRLRRGFGERVEVPLPLLQERWG